MPFPVPPDHPIIALGTYGPGQCWVCEKRFTRGLAIKDAAGFPVASLCMWCLAQWIDEISDTKLTEQLLGWLTTRNKRGRPKDINRGLIIRMERPRDKPL